jgi:TonB family protein
VALPWVKIELFKTTISKPLAGYPEYLWNSAMNETSLSTGNENSYAFSWDQIFIMSGMLIALLIFAFKLYQIHQIKISGTVRYLNGFTRIIIKNSEIAFSFFKSIFIGDKIISQNHKAIIEHELVHIRQGHSYDLIFFELMRIVAWFNPLVYVYQNRISEVHEYIADAEVAKTHKKEQYQLLLTQVFKTQYISFINPFFKSSLIKKRIVMLQKSKSKKTLALKYLLVVPAFLAILFYTSCESDPKVSEENDPLQSVTEEKRIIIEFEDLKNLSPEEKIKRDRLLNNFDNLEKNSILVLKDNKGNSIEFKANNSKAENSMVLNLVEKEMQKFSEEEIIEVYEQKINVSNDEQDIPFSQVENPPIFPGCEDAADKRTCFQEKMFKHISKNFRYPLEAQEKGIQGKVNLMFTIAADGSIQNIRKRGPSESLEAEGERIIAKLPKMTPGKQKGKAVNVPYSIPITFKLQ